MRGSREEEGSRSEGAESSKKQAGIGSTSDQTRDGLALGVHEIKQGTGGRWGVTESNKGQAGVGGAPHQTKERRASGVAPTK